MATIRLAESEDLSGIIDITNQAIRETAANFHVEPRTLDELTAAWQEAKEFYPWVIAEDDGTVLGFASASPYKAKAAYRWTAEVTIYIHPDHRGRGIGHTLYSRLLAILEAQGYRTIVGGITLPNPASIRLHESLGFKHVGTLTRAGWKLARWHDVGFWRMGFSGGGEEPKPLKPVRKVEPEESRPSAKNSP